MNEKVVKIAKGVAAKILQAKDVKLYAMLIRLKSFYVGGSIHNMRYRYPELAKEIGCSQSKLRKTVGKLIAKGWAKYDDNEQDLRLKSLRQITADYQDESLDKVTKKGYFFDFKINIEEQIRFLAFTENAERQKYRKKQKLVNKEVDKVFGKDMCYKMKESATKGVRMNILANIDVLLQQEVKRKHEGTLNHQDDPEMTISLATYAKEMGYKSKTTGKRWVDRLKSKGLIKQTHRKILVKRNVTQGMFKAFISTVEKDLGLYFLYNKNIYKRTACSYEILQPVNTFN